jgi:hypothetical protein
MNDKYLEKVASRVEIGITKTECYQGQLSRHLIFLKRVLVQPVRNAFYSLLIYD